MAEIDDDEYQAWFNSRPKKVQELVLKYPPNLKYRIKEHAPYAISCPGTIVELSSYRENGEVSVIVYPDEKLPSTIEHEKMLCLEFNKNYKEVAEQAVRVVIDPKWLEVVE